LPLDRRANGFYSQRLMPTRVNAHITGTVWKIEVKVGDGVTEGQTVVILESMKMEMPVEAPAAGTVTAVLVQEGQSVEEGAALVELA
jgi:acetyl-CoA carboxylase biotin carboxyl carrier protein